MEMSVSRTIYVCLILEMVRILIDWIECIFPKLNENMASKDYITSRAILSTRNERVDMINMKMISSFRGGEMVYHSFDSVIDDPHNYYPS